MPPSLLTCLYLLLRATFTPRLPAAPTALRILPALPLYVPPPRHYAPHPTTLYHFPWLSEPLPACSRRTYLTHTATFCRCTLLHLTNGACLTYPLQAWTRMRHIYAGAARTRCAYSIWAQWLFGDFWRGISGVQLLTPPPTSTTLCFAACRAPLGVLVMNQTLLVLCPTAKQVGRIPSSTRMCCGGNIRGYWSGRVR